MNHRGYPLQPSKQSAPVVRFGAFELDLRAGELRKHGLKIKLQDQPFQILLMLLEQPGQVVTREQLHQKLWAEGTFVDFEHGLNAAIQRLRTALGDTAENPRFVETLARRGYRFVAPVDGVSSLQETSALLGSIQPANHGPERPRPQRHWHRLGALVSLALVLAGVGWWQFGRRATAPELRIIPFTDFPGWKINPTFSPDGKLVAFAWNGESRENVDIYVKMIDAGGPVRLTTNPAGDDDAAWSPDGRFIAFRRLYTADRCDVLIIPAIGGAERKLAQTASWEVPGFAIAGLSWSPDGKFLAMVDHGIRAVSEQTGEKRVLSSPDPLFYDYLPAFSPDGRSIAFARSRKPGDTFTSVFVQPLGAGATPSGPPRQVTPSMRQVSGLAWESSGRSLLFSSLGMQGHELPKSGIWRISVSGGKPTPLPALGQSIASLTIAPKGDRLAYTRMPLRGHNIYEIPLAGSIGGNNLPRPIDSSAEDDYSPQFSPDGKRIALVSARSGNLEIWTCTSDGASCSPVTAFGGPEVGSPMWSPDSRRIAFDSVKYGEWDVFVADLEGGSVRRLTYGPSNKSRPGWSVDGDWIYFASESEKTGESQVWKIPSKGGSAVQVTRKGGFEAEEGPDGKFVYYAKRGSKGIWRVPAWGGEETQFLDKGAEAQWFLARTGIYLLERETVRGYTMRRIELYSFAKRGFSRVADLPVTAAGVAYNALEPALTVSPDGRRALFSQMDHAEFEIMLVENFR